MTHHLIHSEVSRALHLQPPLLMLDQAWLAPENTPGEKPCAVAVKLISINETLFEGHFPGHPILPGVLQIAAMAQLSELLCQSINGGQRCFLSALKRIRFRRPVFPGTTLQVKAELQAQADDGAQALFWDVKVSCAVEGATVSSCTLTLVPYPEPDRTSSAPFSTPVEHTGALSDASALLKILPHRPPFLLLDGVYDMGIDLTALRGFKNVTAGDALLSASGSSCYPPYLMMESAAQLGCASMLSQPGFDGMLGLFMGIDEAYFTRPVLPGERLDIAGSCESLGKAGLADITFRCAGAAVGSCQLRFVLSPAADVK